MTEKEDLAEEIIKLHLEKFAGKILTKRPEGMLFEAYKIHMKGQRQFLKKYLKGRFIYPGRRIIPLKNDAGKVERYVKLKGVPFVGNIKKSDEWKSTV